MSVNLHIANLLRLAHGDLEAAVALTALGNRNDAYHAEQAAEKILLALLTSEGIRAERKDAHRIDVLQGLLPDANGFKFKFSPIVFLTIYATTYRYPKDAGRLPAQADKDELGTAMDAIRAILDEVARHFGVDLTDSDKVPATSSAAPRI
ncbi:MAG: HEPN domain-containing protein [Hoeflea sp.]|nr:HEPN domain-containing protein [Hoeflea sp.]